VRPFDGGVFALCWLGEQMSVAEAEQRKPLRRGPWPPADDDDDQRLEVPPGTVVDDNDDDTVLAESYCSNPISSFRMLLKYNDTRLYTKHLE